MSGWAINQQEEKFVVTVFLDTKRAFKTINRSTILNKLIVTALEWFRSYLSNITQSVQWQKDYIFKTCSKVLSSIENCFRTYIVYV